MLDRIVPIQSSLAFFDFRFTANSTIRPNLAIAWEKGDLNHAAKLGQMALEYNKRLVEHQPFKQQVAYIAMGQQLQDGIYKDIAGVENHAVILFHEAVKPKKKGWKFWK